MGEDDARSADDRLARILAVVEAQGARIEALTVAVKPASTITIRQLFETFEKTRVMSRSWRNNRNRMVPLVRRLGDLPAALLTPIAWAEHAAERSKETHRYGREPDPHTISTELSRAKELLRFGVEAGLLAASPLEAAKGERTRSERETWLDEDGIQRLIAGCSEIRDERAQLIMRAFIPLCVDLMLRLNEARVIRRDRVRDGTIELAAKSTKSKRRRILGFTPRVLEAIAQIPIVMGSPYVFANPQTGRPFSKSSLSDWFAAARSASGVDALAVEGERVTIHTLRHSGASAADARGASAQAIRDALGHTSLAITEKYLHRHKEAGARDLARLMAEGTEKERRGPQHAPRDAGNASLQSDRTSNR